MEKIGPSPVTQIENFKFLPSCNTEGEFPSADKEYYKFSWLECLLPAFALLHDLVG